MVAREPPAAAATPAGPPPEPPAPPRIPDFYAGRSVFITGATGFMGKVLVERLLSTCPDIGPLFLLMRTKKDVPPEKRLLELKQSQVFDIIRARCPSQLEKLRCVSGDAAKPGLMLDAAERRALADVSVVFHAAATLRFDEELKVAADLNLRSALAVMDLCDSLPGVEALVHVSTAYCMAELSDVAERVYPPPLPPSRLLALVDNADAPLRAALTKQLLGAKPNTYTFTKALAEHAVSERRARYPVAIFRPTIVISSDRYPFPGWIENLNGPSGVAVAAGKGLLHAFRCRMDCRSDLLPVDVAIDNLIAVAWDVAYFPPNAPRVYNCTTSENPTTWRDFEAHMREQIALEPFNNVYWYPSGYALEGRYTHKATEWLTQTAPLYIAEYVTRLFGIQKPMSLIAVSQKLRAMSRVLTFFSTREWSFSNGNMRRVRERVCAADAQLYHLDPNDIQWPELYRNFVKGVRRYLLKEGDGGVEAARVHMRRMQWIHNACKAAALLLLLRVLLRASGAAAVRRLLLALLGVLGTRRALAAAH